MRFALFVSLLCLISCISDHTQRVVDINPMLWAEGEVKQIEFISSDTTNLKDIDLFVRMDESFKRASLPLDIEISQSDGYSVSFREYLFSLDTLAYTMPSAKMRSYELKYLEAVQFSDSGNYIIRFKPQQSLKGVWAVGITIKEHGKR